MSRNGSGVYSLPGGSTVTNGDTSDATDINTPLADLEADMNIPRPVVAGGTGASSAAAALVNLGLTATATELNYTDGVTSAIQTQLDAKPALPQSGAGAGQWTRVQSAAPGASCTLPAGGTWAYFTTVTNPSGQIIAYGASVAAGGTVVYGVTASDLANAFCWRIS